MAWREASPADLEGEALRRWYLRSPEEIEQDRQAATNARYTAFFERKPPSAPPSIFATAQQPADQAQGGTIQPSDAGVESGFTWRPLGSERWRRGKAAPLDRGTRPIPLPSPELGPEDPWSHPVPLPSMHLPAGGPRPIRLSPIYPTAPSASPVHLSTAAQSARPASYRLTQAAAPAPARQQAAAAQPKRHGIWIAGRQPGELDPSRTEVFQQGPDGKLQPVPGWRTTGPFEFDDWSRMFDWRAVAGDLFDITSGALDFMAGGGLAGEVVKGLGYKIGPDVVRGIIHGHHSWPKFMGGPSKQELARLYKSLHVDLEAALKQAGFPRVGGRGGGTQDWTEYFRLNPGKRDEAMGILQDVTREFDRKNGTKISKYLDDSLAEGKPPTPPPSQ